MLGHQGQDRTLEGPQMITSVSAVFLLAADGDSLNTFHAEGTDRFKSIIYCGKDLWMAKINIVR